MSLSNSPSSRGGCAQPAGENWVSTGPGAAVVPRLVGEGEGAEPPGAGVRGRVDTSRAPGCPRVA